MMLLAITFKTHHNYNSAHSIYPPLQLSFARVHREKIKEKSKKNKIAKRSGISTNTTCYKAGYSTILLLIRSLHHHHHLHEAHISCKRWTKTEGEELKNRKKNSQKKRRTCNVNVLYHRKNIHNELHHKILCIFSFSFF